MQVKPRFSKYKILKKMPLLTDDTNNIISLCKFEVLLPSDNDEVIETTYCYWTVCGEKQETYGNKSIGYSSIAFWKSKTKKLLKEEIDGILVEEIEDGSHRVFGENMFFCSPEKVGLRTKFKITKIINHEQEIIMA